MKRSLLLSVVMLLVGICPIVAQTIYANISADPESSSDYVLTFKVSSGTVADSYNSSGIGNYSLARSGNYAYSNFASKIKKAVISEEVKDVLPTSTAFWFYNLSNLKAIDGLENLNTSNVTNMQFMFFGCSGLTSLDFTKYSDFKTDKVITMWNMFYGCTGLTTLNVSTFDTKNLVNMSGMFTNCSSLTTLDLSNFVTTNVTDMSYVFGSCTSLATLDISNFTTDNVTTMASMFDGCTALKNLDVSKFNTSSVTDMYMMFSGCNSLRSLDVSHFDTHLVIRMNSMFQNCYLVPTLDVSHFDTSKVYYMDYMFSGCKSLKALDVSGFNTKKVTSMLAMFQNYPLSSLDISNFVTSSVTDMSYMFNNSPNLTSLNLSNFDTQKVTNMEHMFSGCSSLQSVNISSFNTSKVYNMRSMFQNCSALKSIDVSGFDMTAATNLTSMFQDCSGLTTLDISKWNIGTKRQSYYSSDYFASGCTGLKELILGPNDLTYLGSGSTKYSFNVNNSLSNVGTTAAPCKMVFTFSRGNCKSLQSGNAQLDKNNQVPPYYKYLDGYFYIASTLDCNSDYSPVAKNSADLWQANRTLKGGKWNTMVLPVSLNASQLKKAYGTTVEVCTLSSYDGSKINFKSFNLNNNRADNVIPANTPFLVKPAADIKNLGYVYVKIEAEPAAGLVATSAESADGKWASFIGSYKASIEIGDDCFYFKDNKFWCSAGHSIVKNTRGYFKFSDITSNTSATKAFTLDDDGVSTGIDSIDGVPAGRNAGPVYNLSGQRVGNDYKGIVIINGKKVLRK